MTGLQNYEVRRPGASWVPLKAKNSGDAKRQYCKLFGIKPADPWTGIANLTARKAKGSVCQSCGSQDDVIDFDAGNIK